MFHSLREEGAGLDVALLPHAWIKLDACESVIEGYAGATNGRVACGAGRVYLDLGKCWLMSLIDILGTFSMKDVVECDHGHTTTGPL
jgi:hypothetical protein